MNGGYSQIRDRYHLACPLSLRNRHRWPEQGIAQLCNLGDSLSCHHPQHLLLSHRLGPLIGLTVSSIASSLALRVLPVWLPSIQLYHERPMYQSPLTSMYIYQLLAKQPQLHCPAMELEGQQTTTPYFLQHCMFPMPVNILLWPPRSCFYRKKCCFLFHFDLFPRTERCPLLSASFFPLSPYIRWVFFFFLVLLLKTQWFSYFFLCM